MSDDYKKYMKKIQQNQGLLMTEAVGYGVGGKIASTVDTSLGTTTASGVFSTGASLAGVPSLVHGAGNVLGSLKMLDQGAKKRRK